MSERRCFTCAHSRDRAGDMLHCRRYPPTVMPTVQGTTLLMMGWPEVYSNSVCGEWSERPTKPASPAQPDAAPASILVSAMEEGAKAERAAIVQWLSDAQYHVVTQDEVSVLIKVRRQIEKGLHIPAKKGTP